MKTNENYFDSMESKDFEILKNFNDDVKFFSKLTYNQKGSKIDATALTKKGKKCHIEIKQRTGEYGDFKNFIEHFDTIFIDTGKLDWFSRIMTSGFTNDEKELFMSIFNNGDIVIIHDLNKPQTIEWLPNQRLWNHGTKKWDSEHRLGFYWYNGIIFEKDEITKSYRRWTDEEISQLIDKQHKYLKKYNES